MNSDKVTSELRSALESSGLEVLRERHPSSLRVEFDTCPPLTSTFADCDRITKKVHSSQVNGRPVSDIFSTKHDRHHHCWRFHLKDFRLAP